jgi:hypothetical protein
MGYVAAAFRGAGRTEWEDVMKPKIVAVTMSLALGLAAATKGQTLEWVRQFGSERDDASYGVSMDSLGNTYVSGIVGGILEGPGAGRDDAFLGKFDAGGTLQWTRQFGSSETDRATGVSADEYGNVYVAGETDGVLSNTTPGGTDHFDAFVGKYDSDGVLQWVRQLGTSQQDSCQAVSADELGNVYITGVTYGALEGTNAGGDDAFVAKYDSGGNLQWIRQCGSPFTDWGTGVATDGLGSVYVSGYCQSNAEGARPYERNAFLSKYGSDGTHQWTRQLGSNRDDHSHAVAADGLGNVYISGFTYGDLEGSNAGQEDAFVSKFDNDGNLQWTRQVGTSEGERGRGVATDGHGNAYLLVEGYPFMSAMSAEDSRLLVNKYDEYGTLQWAQDLEIGAAGYALAADRSGNVVVSGLLFPNYETFHVSADVFVAKMSSVPEPSAFVLLTLASVALLRRK